jgi:hypothetical protein
VEIHTNVDFYFNLSLKYVLVRISFTWAWRMLVRYKYAVTRSALAVSWRAIGNTTTIRIIKSLEYTA